MEHEPTTASTTTTTTSTINETWSSPNAKLLCQYGRETPPLPTTLDFPLKSSFRGQSYANPAQFNTPNSQLKYNTQLNSGNPNPSIKLKKPIDPPKTNLIPSSSPAKTQIPHRIIRTPRSFLIKRRGSLTPLMHSFPRLDSDQDSASDQDQERLQNPGPPLENLEHKRKVRFDRDVFCLEFDQLPEELPLSRQKRLKIHPENDASSSTQPLGSDEDPQQRSLRRRSPRSASIIHSSTRPRRHSPRLLPMLLPIATDYTPTDTHNNHLIDQGEQEMDSTTTYIKAEPNPTQVNNSNDKVGTRTKANNESNSTEKNNVEGKNNEQEGRIQPTEGSFPSGMVRQRASSLPFDLYRDNKVDPVDDLEAKLNGLNISLDREDKRKEEKPERLIRSSSLPNLTSWFLGSSGGKKQPIGRDTGLIPSFPGLASFDFAPRLEGVKQILMHHPYVNKINSSIQNFFYNTTFPSSMASSIHFNDLLFTTCPDGTRDRRGHGLKEQNEPVQDMTTNKESEKATVSEKDVAKKITAQPNGRKNQASSKTRRKSSPISSKKLETDPVLNTFRPITRSFLASHLNNSNSPLLSTNHSLPLSSPTTPTPTPTRPTRRKLK